MSIRDLACHHPEADDRFARWTPSDLSDWQRVVGGKIKLGDHLVKLTGRQLLIEGDDRQPELALDITPFRERQRLAAVSDGDVNCGGGSSGTAELGAGLLVHAHTTACAAASWSRARAAVGRRRHRGRRIARWPDPAGMTAGVGQAVRAPTAHLILA